MWHQGNNVFICIVMQLNEEFQEVSEAKTEITHFYVRMSCVVSRLNLSPKNISN